MTNIIVFTDSIPTPNGGGISQTLFNLLDGYPADQISIIADEKEINSEDTAFSVITINLNALPLLHNRIGTFINSIILFFNRSIREFFFQPSAHFKKYKNVYIFLSTTNIDKLHYAICLHRKYGFPLITYYMDDWMANINTRWLGGNVQRLITESLQKARGLLFISDFLAKTLYMRYNWLPKPEMIVHNPVAVFADVKQEPTGIFTIVYAGSIWPMHADALYLLARSVSVLHQQNINLQLVIYTKPFFWEQHKKYLDVSGVKYGGFIEYKYMPSTLQNANLLVVTSSFKKEFAAFSASSVQTKLTDYMNAGRAILSIGPHDGACNQFVQKWQIGWVQDSENSTALSEQIVLIMNDYHSRRRYAENGHKAIAQYFTKEIVQQHLYQFIRQLT